MYGLTSSILAGSHLQGIRDAAEDSRRHRECEFTNRQRRVHAPMGGVRNSGWGRTGPLAWMTSAT